MYLTRFCNERQVSPKVQDGLDEENIFAALRFVFVY
jgi:hypothetical protein